MDDAAHERGECGGGAKREGLPGHQGVHEQRVDEAVKCGGDEAGDRRAGDVADMVSKPAHSDFPRRISALMRMSWASRFTVSAVPRPSTAIAPSENSPS